MGRVGDPTRLIEIGSGTFFHLVEDVEVTIGDGLGSRGLPEAESGVCCVEAGYDGGPTGAGRGVCGYCVVLLYGEYWGYGWYGTPEY